MFLFAFAMQTFSKAVIVVDFYANQDFIAKNLCENKAKPQLNCCGKCQLKKKLNQEEKSDQQNPERKGENKNEVLSSKFYTPQVSAFYASVTTTYSILQIPSITDRASNIFRPPCA